MGYLESYLIKIGMLLCLLWKRVSNNINEFIRYQQAQSLASTKEASSS